MTKIKNLTGNKYGLLTVIEFSEIKGKRTFWKCQCKCGTEVIVRADSLPKRISCGCALASHGESTNHVKTKEYEAWGGIKARCYNTKHKRFKYYGAKGITVCDRWLNSYESFLKDMGRAPSKKHSIDRIDVNGNYEPSNCRWATHKEQMNNTTFNRKITLNGITKNVTQWCELLNINPIRVYDRLYKGWTEERALYQKIR